MSKKRSCFVTIIVLLALCGSVQADLAWPGPLDDYAIRVSGSPGQFSTVVPQGWPHSWNSATQTLSLLNGYMGPNWRKILTIEVWVSGGSFDPARTTVPSSQWVGVAEAYGTTPGGSTHGFCTVAWEPLPSGGYHYGLKGYICPQPPGEAFDFSIIAGGGRIDQLDVRTTCIPGTCVPEPSGMIALAGCLSGLPIMLRRRSR